MTDSKADICLGPQIPDGVLASDPAGRPIFLTKQLSKGKGEYLPPKDTASAVTFGDGARVLVMGENLSTLYQRYLRGFKKNGCILLE